MITAKSNKVVTLRHADRAGYVERITAEFGAAVHVVSTVRGPLVETLQLRPAPGVRARKVVGLAEDIALRLGVPSVRIGALSSGVFGLEVPHEEPETVQFRRPHKRAGAMPVFLGVDTRGNGVTVDLADAPHVLVAGSTGSGKSIALHTLICSLWDQRVHLVLIDPKRLEFRVYDDGTDRATVIVEPADAVAMLADLVAVMDHRYRTLERAGARDVQAYQSRGGNMPRVVVIVDEWADLLATCGKQVEELVTRLGQKARAAGIHLVCATQRPDAKIIPGTLKTNFPARLALRVGSAVDSRVILDTGGAEALLGRGDALLSGFGRHTPERIHGAYVSPANWIAR